VPPYERRPAVNSLTPVCARISLRSAVLAVVLFAAALGGLLGVALPRTSAACDRVNYSCQLSGEVVRERCFDFSCYGKCSSCTNCVSNGCCYHEYMSCPAWPEGSEDVSIICGGKCLRSFDWE
jgi:hypothetical protein